MASVDDYPELKVPLDRVDKKLADELRSLLASPCNVPTIKNFADGIMIPNLEEKYTGDGCKEVKCPYCFIPVIYHRDRKFSLAFKNHMYEGCKNVREKWLRRVEDANIKVKNRDRRIRELIYLINITAPDNPAPPEYNT